MMANTKERLRKKVKVRRRKHETFIHHNILNVSEQADVSLGIFLTLTRWVKAGLSTSHLNKWRRLVQKKTSRSTRERNRAKNIHKTGNNLNLLINIYNFNQQLKLSFSFNTFSLPANASLFLSFTRAAPAVQFSHVIWLLSVSNLIVVGSLFTERLQHEPIITHKTSRGEMKRRLCSLWSVRTVLERLVWRTQTEPELVERVRLVPVTRREHGREQCQHSQSVSQDD